MSPQVIGREQESGCYIKVIGLRGILFSLCFFFSAAMLFLTVVFQGKRIQMPWAPAVWDLPI